MNKKKNILTEAKRLFGEYGYLGFTLKQLAVACNMTAPAVYYFYSSKADLFRDCLISEMSIRNEYLSQLAEQPLSISEFTRALISYSLEVCGASHLRTGQAMEEIIHLEPAIQQDLRTAWSQLMIAPVEKFLAHTLPAESPSLSHCLLATFFINIATFAAARVTQFDREELIALAIAAAQGLEQAALTS